MTSKKTISVLLRKKVNNLGQAGDIKSVAVGYARNYLVPRQLVFIATPSIIEQSKSLIAKKAAKKEAQVNKAKVLADKVKGVQVVMRVKAGQKGKLFGAITTKKIAESLYSQHSIKINDKEIDQSKPIKTLGQHAITLNLPEGIKTTLNVKVISSKN